MAESTGVTGEFPVWGLVPRRETGVVNFLAKHPEYDGRNTVVAIFDSGVDPAAAGMQITTDGKVKVLDRIDASGAGDVDTTKIVKAKDGYITGITGRRLKIPETWPIPASGEYRIGTKNAFSLYPGPLKDRIYEFRKATYFTRNHKPELAKAKAELLKYEANGCSQTPLERYPNDTEEDGDSLSVNSPDTEAFSTALINRCEKEDLEAKVSILNTMDKKYKDYGPVYDCVLFYDGQIWRACIDTSETGDLEKGVFLGEYIKTHEHAFLTPEDMFTVSINVYEDGDILEICGMCTAHGTHVASIAAANFPKCPEKNGVAPGAQIVSITIGDSRLGSMETTAALVRAMSRVMQNPHYKVDVINMSYGEHALCHRVGRFVQLAHEVVNDYGVIWVASASNNGPALSTIGTPPSMKSESIIGVGAHVTPDMMTAGYSLTEKLPISAFTWSSRGPTADGCRGATICAPGGAITSVPCYTFRSSQLMNGTSMSSPHTAGAVALLVSGSKAKNIDFTPYLVRRAMENTALKLDGDIFAQGHGLLQVDKAFEYLLQFPGGCEDKVRFHVEAYTGGLSSKAIYLRNWKADSWKEFQISVEPFMLNNLEADPQQKLAFEAEYILLCDAPWVKAPTCLQMSYNMRHLKVQIDPRGLARGQAYFTSVKAFCSKQPERGHIFEIPITVVVPHLEEHYENGSLFKNPAELYRPGTVRHNFFATPKEATWAKISLRSKHGSKPMRFALHALQLKPGCSIKAHELYKIFELQPKEENSYVMNVKGGLTLEVCIARWWSCLVDGEVEFDVEFHGITTTCDVVSVIASDHCQRLDLTAHFRSEDMHVSPVLKYATQTAVPFDSRVEVLGRDRDTIPKCRPVYQLELSYAFNVAKSTMEVTPKMALLSDVLYESPFDSQFYMVFNSNKCLMMCGDAYSEKYSCKLEKGEYVVKYFIRHERFELLEKLVETPIAIYIKLPSEIKLDAYSQYNEAITAGKKVSTSVLKKDKIVPLYITAPNQTDKNSKVMTAAAGSLLVGTVSFSKDEQVRKVVNYPLKVVLLDNTSKKKSYAANSSDEKREGKTFDDYLESLKEFQASWISKLDKTSELKLFAQIQECEDTHIPTYVAHLLLIQLDSDEGRKEAAEIISKILSTTDMQSYLEYTGQKTDIRKDFNKMKTQMEKQKNWIVDTYATKGAVWLAKLKSQSPEFRIKAREEELDRCIVDILKIVDTSDSKVYQLLTDYYSYRGFYSLETRLRMRYYEEHKTKENYLKLIECHRNLDLDYSVTQLELSLPVYFPRSYEHY